MSKKLVMNGMMVMFLFLLLLFQTRLAGAVSTWSAWYNGPWDAWYNGSPGKAVLWTSDNGIVVAGDINSCENGNFCTYGYLAGFNGFGEPSWALIIGDPDNPSTHFDNVIQTTDGGYVAVGYTKAGGIGLVDLLVIRFDRSGQLRWQKAIGHASFDEYGQRVYENDDGSLTVLGLVYGDCQGNFYYNLNAYDLDGNTGQLLKDTKVAGSGYHTQKELYRTSDGGFIALQTISYPSDYYTVTVQKKDAQGLMTWSKAYCAKNEQGEILPLGAKNTMMEVEDGYVLYSNTGSTYGLYHFKINKLGEVQWMKKVDVYNGGQPIVASPIAGAVGGFVLSIKNAYTTIENVILKTDLSGNLLWARQYAGSGTFPGLFNAVISNNQGQLIAAGAMTRLQLARLDSSGQLGKPCNNLPIIDKSVTVVDVPWLERGGSDVSYCEFPEATSTDVNLFYSQGFSQKIHCGNAPGAAIQPAVNTILFSD